MLRNDTCKMANFSESNKCTLCEKPLSKNNTVLLSCNHPYHYICKRDFCVLCNEQSFDPSDLSIFKIKSNYKKVPFDKIVYLFLY